MEDELITKKDLLELTGISYGALYRWKRMKLLPDEWFIRRSTFTGHETFFPREKVLNRVAEIQKLKESMSLEMIAQAFQPEKPDALSLTSAEVISAGLVSKPILEQFAIVSEKKNRYNYRDLLQLRIFEHLLQKGMMSREEACEAAETAVNAVYHEEEEVSEPLLVIARKYGVLFCLVISEAQKIYRDNNTIIIDRVHVAKLRSELTELLRTKGVIKS